MYDNILIPTDGRDTAAVAVSHAVDHAATYGARLHAPYVVDVDAVASGLGAEQIDRSKQGNSGEMTELQERAKAATGVAADTATERVLRSTHTPVLVVDEPEPE